MLLIKEICIRDLKERSPPVTKTGETRTLKKDKRIPGHYLS